MSKTKTVEGQLRPLSQRLTAIQLAQRAERINWRQGLQNQHAVTRGIANASYALLGRGFFGRLKWLVLGR